MKVSSFLSVKHRQCEQLGKIKNDSHQSIKGGRQGRLLSFGGGTQVDAE